MCTNPGLSSRLCGKPGIVILSPRKADHRIPVDWVEICPRHQDFSGLMFSHLHPAVWDCGDILTGVGS